METNDAAAHEPIEHGLPNPISPGTRHPAGERAGLTESGSSEGTTLALACQDWGLPSVPLAEMRPGCVGHGTLTLQGGHLRFGGRSSSYIEWWRCYCFILGLILNDLTGIVSHLAAIKQLENRTRQKRANHEPTLSIGFCRRIQAQGENQETELKVKTKQPRERKTGRRRRKRKRRSRRRRGNDEEEKTERKE